MDTNTIIIQKTTIQRLLKDIKDIKKEPLNSHGIYYTHSDSDMLKGYCLIIGPKNTPYQFGNYFFEINYPHDYPFRPPVLKYLTNDSITRFNPNLYKNGKVCISILNTWQGPQWSACQNISSILLSLSCMVFVKNPLLNEPGITAEHSDFFNYNKIIQYKNIDVAINQMLTSNYIKSTMPELHLIAINEFKINFPDIIKYIDSIYLLPTFIQTEIYHMSINIDYKKTKQQCINIFNDLC